MSIDRVPFGQAIRLRPWLAAVVCAGIVVFGAVILSQAVPNYHKYHLLNTSGVIVRGTVVDEQTHDDWTRNRVRVHYRAGDVDYDHWVSARTPGSNIPKVGDAVDLLYQPGHPTTVVLKALASESGYRAGTALGAAAIVIAGVAAVLELLVVWRRMPGHRWEEPLPLGLTILLAVGATTLGYWLSGLVGAGNG